MKHCLATALTILAADGAPAQDLPPPAPKSERSDIQKVCDAVGGAAEKPLKDLHISGIDVDA